MTDNQNRSMAGLLLIFVFCGLMNVGGWPLGLSVAASMVWGCILAHYGYSPFQFLKD